MHSLNTIRRINAEARRLAAKSAKPAGHETQPVEYIAKSGKRVTINEPGPAPSRSTPPSPQHRA